MSVSTTVQLHFSPGDVRHKHTPSYSTLDFGSGPGRTAVFFRDPAEIDEVVAELVALRAEMTGEADDTWRLTPKGEATLDAEAVANPPHHATPAGEKACTASGWEDKDSGYVCTAQDGHDGDHVAYKPDGGEYHRWPVAAPEPVIRVELKAHVFTLREPGGVLCNCGQLREHSIHVAPEPASVAS